jgi:hypothetical protein
LGKDTRTLSTSLYLRPPRVDRFGRKRFKKEQLLGGPSGALLILTAG